MHQPYPHSRHHINNNNNYQQLDAAHQLYNQQLELQQQLQDLKNLDAFSQQLHTPLSSQSLTAPPLTPVPSQSHSQSSSQSYLQSSPLDSSSAGTSPTYSPIYSTENSPSIAFASTLAWQDPDCFMQDDSFHSTGALPHTPPIKVYQSTPPFGDDSFDSHDIGSASMLLQSGHSLDNEFNNLLSPVKFSSNNNNNQYPRSASSQQFQRPLYPNIQHKRASSASSGISLPSTTAVPALSPPTAPNYQSFSQSASTPQRPLPTPEHTPVQNSFLAPPFQSYNPSDGDNAAAEIAMRRAIMEQQRQQHPGQQQPQQRLTQAEDESTFQYSLAPSVSSVSHNSPATPQASYPDELDESSKAMRHDQNPHQNTQMGMPKLNRTISDIYQDELYNPAMASGQQDQKPSQSAYPGYRNVNLANRLQAAQQGHMAQSNPPTSMGRQHSPFRQSSPYAHLQPNYPGTHLQQPSQPGSALRGMLMTEPEPQEEPKTISPKDALLDYHESDNNQMPPLFPSQPDSSQFNIPASMGTSSSFQNFTPLSEFPGQYRHNGQSDQQLYLPQTQQHAPQLPRQEQHHPFQTHQPHSQPEGTLLHHAPDFSTQMPSMATTASDRSTVGAPTGLTHSQSTSSNEAMRRPANTSSDAGTYSCTYHGCTQRFETPGKLQKHKREAHRGTTPGSQALVHDTAAHTSLAMRNSQAGPHKCERINPSTGKPCNSIFSRPYDLTRHEDTIHNARKQKVRCQLCTEEKTFSRNDALTRHMRVVHPDVNWPGKQRRRGRD